LAGAHVFGLIEGEKGSVVLRAEGRVRNVPIDSAVGDWKLVKIEARSAIFARDKNETRVIKLEYAKLNAPPPQAPLAAQGNPGARASGPPATSIGGIAIPQNLPDSTRLELEERLRNRAALANR
jgi:hypothetical protein